MESLSGEDVAKKSGREVGATSCWGNAMGDQTAESGKNDVGVEGLEAVGRMAKRHQQD